MNSTIENTFNMTPSLARSAMLVDFNVSQWTGRKKDRNTSEEIVLAKKAKSKKAATVYNALLGDCKELDAISKFVSHARTTHMKMTLPWNDSGTRLLPAKAMLEYTAFISTTQQEFQQLVNNFLACYPTLRSAAAFELGDLFDANNYPDVSDVAPKFGINCNYTPVPCAGDFRLDTDAAMMDDMVEHFREQYEETLQVRMAQAAQDMWGRLHKQLVQMVDRLGVVDGKQNVFRDSLVTNAVELTHLLDVLNPTKDPELDRARVDLVNLLNGVTPERLREDSHARERTLDKITAMLDEYDFGALNL